MLTGSLPKASELAVTPSPEVPVPLSEIDCGLLGALVTTVSVPVCARPTVGGKDDVEVATGVRGHRPGGCSSHRRL